jgi:topoisomerase-4 subunit A
MFDTRDIHVHVPEGATPKDGPSAGVGMATAIPPHNAAELCDAALFLIDNPNARSKTLLKYVKGPDFPTGGIIVDSGDAIAEAYATGRGALTVGGPWL